MPLGASPQKYTHQIRIDWTNAAIEPRMVRHRVSRGRKASKAASGAECLMSAVNKWTWKLYTAHSGIRPQECEGGQSVFR